tara:strand:+ start:261 stop:530 length:270 start_codon:yes stop_codon:yes gene_type:complete
MDYNQADIQQGTLNRKRSEETPALFAEENGADTVFPDTANMAQKDSVSMGRFAADFSGPFVQAMMQDPAVDQKVKGWTNLLYSFMPPQI